MTHVAIHTLIASLQGVASVVVASASLALAAASYPTVAEADRHMTAAGRTVTRTMVVLAF